jgi:hypothetical protein
MTKPLTATNGQPAYGPWEAVRELTNLLDRITETLSHLSAGVDGVSYTVGEATESLSSIEQRLARLEDLAEAQERRNDRTVAGR